MIPKVIHYCWFGGNDFSEKETACINSWKKYCPDYEIVRWDESNFDIYANEYISEAYNNKKWAFVSDYARFKILFDNGGVYFDTDVELIKPIDDIVLNGPFFGLERTEHRLGNMCIAPGLGMGAAKGERLYREILDYYDKASFVDGGAIANTKTVVEIVTEIFLKYGFEPSTSIQQIEGFNIYPPDYFDPMDFQTGLIDITPNTYSIHRYAGTWLSPESKRIQTMRYRLVKVFGKRIGILLSNAHGAIVRFHCRLKKLGLKSTIKFYSERIKTSSKE